MKNFRHPGASIAYANPYGVKVNSGDIVDIALARPGVAITDIDAGKTADVTVEGVFEFAKDATYGLLAGQTVLRKADDFTKVVPAGDGGDIVVGRVVESVAASATKVLVQLTQHYVPGRSAGAIDIFEDFTGPIPAIDVDFGAGPLAKFNTAAAGGAPHVASDEAGGVLKMSFDAVAEAAMAAIGTRFAPALAARRFWFETRVNIVANGSAALDFFFGVASEVHASDMEAAAVLAGFQMDGAATGINLAWDDGGANDALSASGANYTLGGWHTLTIDGRDLAALKFFLDGTQIGTTLSPRWAGLVNQRIMPVIHVEKTVDAGVFDLRVDHLAFRGSR